jgi:hypothetical protein
MPLFDGKGFEKDLIFAGSLASAYRMTPSLYQAFAPQILYCLGFGTGLRIGFEWLFNFRRRTWRTQPRRGTRDSATRREVFSRGLPSIIRQEERPSIAHHQVRPCAC